MTEDILKDPEINKRPALAKVYSLLIRLAEEAESEIGKEQNPEDSDEKSEAVCNSTLAAKACKD